MNTGILLVLIALVASAFFPTSSSSSPVDFPFLAEGGIRGDSIPVDPSPEPEGECVITALILRGSAEVDVIDPGACGSGMSTRPLSAEDSFDAPFTVKTDAKTLVELSLPDGSVIRIGPNSKLEIDNFHCNEDDPPFSFQLNSGSMWGKVLPGSGEEQTLRIGTENGVVGVKDGTFSVAMRKLDTVFKRKIIELYPPEYRSMAQGLDTNMTLDVPVKGTATNVAVFKGSVDVEDRLFYKTTTVTADREFLIGLDGVPSVVEPLKRGRGFDEDGNLP